MDGLETEHKPSANNILKKFYRKVVRLDEHIREKVSENRYTRILAAAREHEAMKKLIEMAYVCMNPRIHLEEDEDELADISTLSIGDNATQSEVGATTARS